MLAKNLAVDVGTANFVIYKSGTGVILNEPSVVAIIDNGNSKLPYAFGEKAKMMIGRAHADIEIIRPVRGGAVADFHAVEEMTHHFIHSINKGWKITRPILVIATPYNATTTEKIAIQEAAMKSGARDVFLVYEPIAAALGANLNITDHSGCMIVDIGGGTAEIAILALGGIVCGKSIKTAGDKMIDGIVEFVRTKQNLLIGQATAENIMKKIGCAYVEKNEVVRKISIKGRDFKTGIPKEIEISQEDVAIAILSCVAEIVKAIKEVLDSAPPELASDIYDKGIVLTGGCAQIKNIDKVITDVTGINVFIAHEPLFCVINGLGKIVDNFDLCSSLMFKQF